MKLDTMKEKKKKQKSYDLRYPKEICRFDDDFLQDDLAYIQDIKILNTLKQKCEDAKILWEASDQASIYNLSEGYVKGNDPISYVFTRPKQFLVYLHLAISYAKLLASKGRLDRHRSLSVDKQTIGKLYCDSFGKAKFCLERELYTCDMNFSHPFAKIILIRTPDEAVQEIQSANYKREEALFIRASNSDRKIILDTIVEQIALHKNIVLHRFQISTEAIFASSAIVGSNHYKSDLSILYDRISSLSKNNLICAIHSIFPSALSRAGLEGFEGTIGHLALVFSKNALTQDKNFSLSLLNSRFLNNNIAFGAIAMDPTQKGYKNKAIGSVPSLHSCQALEQLADFMTIERRYIRPGFRIPCAPSFTPGLKKQHTLFVKQFK